MRGPFASVVRARRAAPLALLAGLACAHCGGEGSAPQDAGVASAVLSPEGPPPRRPTRRFYLARTAERCEIFAQDGDDRTDPLVTPCPDFLLIGERIRVVGMTCTLENRAQPEREKPIVCPDPLTRFEKDLRADGGAPSTSPSAEPLEPDAGKR